MLEQEFNADALHVLRKTVLACSMAAGMPESRATDVMLVAHELAANSVRYGGGRGRLCIWTARRGDALPGHRPRDSRLRRKPPG